MPPARLNLISIFAGLFLGVLLVMEKYASKLRRNAPGLYAVLNVHARRVFGRRLESLSISEFARLVDEVLPGRWELVSAIMGLRDHPFGVRGRRRKRGKIAVVVVEGED
jgi:hypothetical protein